MAKLRQNRPSATFLPHKTIQLRFIRPAQPRFRTSVDHSPMSSRASSANPSAT
jgi:hypothetical protein